MLVPNSVFFLHKGRKQRKREGVKVANGQEETVLEREKGGGGTGEGCSIYCKGSR